MTSPRPPASLLDAAGEPDDSRSRFARIAEPILVRLLVRVLVVLVLLAVGGAILARVRAGMVSEPVSVAPGVIGERGSGAWLYALKLHDGIALVDAGRDPKGRPIDAALAPLGAHRADVSDVLVTHGHPSETVGLASVRGARIHAGAADVAMIAGRERAGNGIDKVLGYLLPRTTTTVSDPIAGERTFEVGGEQVFAFPVPGHSLGSTAYLVRDLLFVGDAASFHGGRLVPGPSFMSADRHAAERTLVRLARRVLDRGISRICTSHTGCSEPGQADGLLREAASRAIGE